MPPAVSDNGSPDTSSYWEYLMDGGPLYILFHFLFALSVIVALILIFRRRAALPWMLLMACNPFIWASAAAHIGFLGHLVVLGSDVPVEAKVAPFIYDMRLFNWGCVLSLALMAQAFVCRPRNGK